MSSRPQQDEHRTKIVCTLGPATASPGAMRALVDAGMDVARLNFSHGTHAEHAALYELVRQAADELGRAVAVLADLQGPKIRLGTFEGGAAVLEPGALFTLTTEAGQGTSQRASVSYEALAREMSPGDSLLIDDGLIKLSALSSNGQEINCRVVDGGPLSDHKGVNLPDTPLHTPALTEKDVDDLAFALGLGVDMVALSFVRQAGDAAAVHQVMDAVGRRVPVIAKIEKPEAVTDLEAIVVAFDGLMVARGDLAIEVSLEQVPLIQKDVVQLAREHGKPVIVATQLLESMIHNARPTRAEASDVANAVLDGADALMMAGETSVGDHAVGAVTTVANIAAAAEYGALARIPALGRTMTSPEEAIASAAISIGAIVGARALVVFTRTGMTAQRLSGHRSPIPVLAFTSEPEVRSRLALAWGVETFIAPVARDAHEEMDQVDEAMLRLGRGHPGERVVIVAGQPGRTGSTSTVRVHELASARHDARVA